MLIDFLYQFPLVLRDSVLLSGFKLEYEVYDFFGVDFESIGCIYDG